MQDEDMFDNEENTDEWLLSDLLGDYKQYANRSKPSQENLFNMLEELHDEFVPTDEEIHPSRLLAWLSERFFIDFEYFSFNDLESKVRARIYQLLQLDIMLKETSLPSTDATIKEKISRIAHVIRSGRDTLFRSAILFHYMDPGREMNLPPEAGIETIFNQNEEKLTSFQSLLLHVLTKLKIAEYRKMEDMCWEQIRTKDGICTHAWKHVALIKDFLHHSIQKEIDFDQWKNLTNPRDNDKHIVEHLVNSEHIEFPSLKVNRYHFSFQNGIYDVLKDAFWLFEEEEIWDEKARELTEYRRSKGWGDDYIAVPPNDDDVSVKYFDQDFRFIIDPEHEETFNPKQISLPEFDKICNSQKLDDDTRDWLILMMCRLFYPVRLLDDWQVILFIKGVAGSGKSTLAKYVRHMYPPNLVTTLSSNIEHKFGLSAIYKGLICVCAEVREDFGLDQGDWQSAASGEEVQVAIKGKTAISHTWTTPFFFFG